MNIGATRPIPDEVLAAYLDGEVTPSESAMIQAELVDSGSTRRRLEELRDIRDALANPIDDIEELDLVDSLDRALDGVAPARPRRSWLRSWYTISAAAAACLATMGAARLLGRRSDDDIRAKSSTLAAKAQFADIQAYRVAPGAKAVRLGTRMAASDGLVFSYTNLGHEAYEYLMVFGVDARGEVRWFFPAYEDESANPQSIHIEKGRVGVELRETIYHRFAPGLLTIHALFTPSPLLVREVEARVQAAPAGSTVTPSSSSTHREITVRVDP